MYMYMYMCSVCIQVVRYIPFVDGGEEGGEGGGGEERGAASTRLGGFSAPLERGGE